MPTRGSCHFVAGVKKHRRSLCLRADVQMRREDWALPNRGRRWPGPRKAVRCLPLFSFCTESFSPPPPFVSASSSVMQVLVLAPDHAMLCHLPIACSQGTRTSAHLVLRLLRATVESDMITALCPPGRGHVLLCFLSSSFKLSKMVQWYKGKHRLH